MAGIITIFEAGAEGADVGTLNIGSRALFLLYDFFVHCKNNSSILAIDQNFDPQSDREGVWGLTKYLSLADQSDTTVADIERLLREVVDPAHPLWQNHELLFASKFLDELRHQGKDVEGFIRESIDYYQTSFRQVADLIHKRLECMPTSD